MTSICRHIKTNGERCGSPALNDHAFCYYHRNLTQRHPRPPAPDPTPAIIHPMDPLRELQLAAITQSNLNLPLLEDRESIQLAASMIIGALARNVLDTKRAATLLYGLQVASANAVRLNHAPSLDYIVTQTTLTPTGEEIALDEDPPGEIAFREFLRNYENDDHDEDEEDDEYTPNPAVSYLARAIRNDAQKSFAKIAGKPHERPLS
jgi:hypothetical protein